MSCCHWARFGSVGSSPSCDCLSRSWPGVGRRALEPSTLSVATAGACSVVPCSSSGSLNPMSPECCSGNDQSTAD